MSRPERDEFEAELSRNERTSLIREVYEFLLDNKKWWLTPIIVAILGLGLLVFLTGTGAAPFIYTLF
ncbi:MAG: hypothetical protein JW751_04730 [Polyangiaceae bacterium]|nr:hypothetical protein [Polyangiaceae bacterium]